MATIMNPILEYNISAMAKSRERMLARRLRESGYSIKNIAKKLKVSVSSVSNWVRDIELTPEQRAVLEEHARNPYYGKRKDYLDLIKRTKEQKIERLRKGGIREIGGLSKRELFLVGSALYWAEGFKKDSQVGFANQDPDMVRLFIMWLNKCFGYNLSQLTARTTINIGHKKRASEINDYWSQITGIPLNQFKKPIYQRVKWKKVYDNPNDYYGVLRIKVRKSKDFLRRIYGFIEGLKLNLS